jgi:hypothetical protein
MKTFVSLVPKSQPPKHGKPAWSAATTQMRSGTKCLAKYPKDCKSTGLELGYREALELGTLLIALAQAGLAQGNGKGHLTITAHDCLNVSVLLFPEEVEAVLVGQQQAVA